MIRLQKIIAEAGIVSRRKAETLITEGRVSVNGVIVTELGTKASLEDEIKLDGKLISEPPEKVYICLNKPAGVVTTVSDPLGRKTVMDFLPTDKRLFPVGRLDYDTSGLLLVTNCGDWAYELTHPGKEISKTYIATLQKAPTEAGLKKLQAGVVIDGRKTAPCRITMTAAKTAEIEIHEGRNRQVRKMFEVIGCTVAKLKRVKIGELELGNLQPKEWKYIEPGSVFR